MNFYEFYEFGGSSLQNSGRNDVEVWETSGALAWCVYDKCVVVHDAVYDCSINVCVLVLMILAILNRSESQPFRPHSQTALFGRSGVRGVSDDVSVNLTS